MAYEQKLNTGSLFKNDRKESDSHPDYKGSFNVEGLGECWLDAWLNTSKDGTKYMSLKLKPKDQQFRQQAQEAARPQPVADQGVTDSSVPF